MPRKVIYTDKPFVDRTNIIDILRKALGVHRTNVAEMKFLFDFESGEQPITRIKTYRPTIDIHCVDNVAHEITKFHVGYEWGNPITLIQRGEKDSGNADEALAISLLNEQYETEGIKTKTQKLGKDVTIANLGYTHVDLNMDWEDGDSYFKLNTLNPYTTFVIRSSYYIDNRVMVGVTFRKDELSVEHYTCYTKDTRFDICQDKIEFEEMNPLGKIPIIEWIGNYDGMGIWEHEISEMNNLNLMISDFSNNVEQNMQAIWHANDVDFPTEVVTDENGVSKEVVRKPKNGEWLQTYTPQDGKTPVVEALTINYDYASMLTNIMTRRQLIMQKCYCPQRNDDSGGSTGVAMQSAAGWSALDIVAESIQSIQESCKMEEVKVVLAAIKVSPFIDPDSPLLKLTAKDVQPNVKRQKLSEMNTKVNALSTLLAHGIHGLHAIKSVNYFEDANQVWEDSKDLIERYQSSVFDTSTGGDAEQAPNSDRLMPDLSDQTGNSPLLGENKQSE